MKDVVGKECTVGDNVFNMQLLRSAFLVKNFTNSPIKVKLGDNEKTSTIGAQSYQIVFNNTPDNFVAPTNTKKVTVIAEASGYVEVESMEY